MTDKVVFVSDVHLTKAHPHRVELFFRFLKNLETQNITHLIFLGDIFDVWIGDKQIYIEEFKSITKQIQKLRKQGIKLIYFEGNHDFLLGKFWKKTLGAKVYKKTKYLTFNNQVFCLEHGDWILPHDYGYRIYTFFIRSPLVQLILSFSTGKFVYSLGQKMSRHNKQPESILNDKHPKKIKTDNKPSKVLEESIETRALKLFKKKKYDVLIQGHIHKDYDKEIKHQDAEIRIINLGTWMNEAQYFILKELDLFQKLI